jgi:hypothetical protein
VKAILEFNLPEDNDEYDIHTNSGKFFVAIDDYLGMLRQIVKYGELLEGREAEIVDDMLNNMPEMKEYSSYDRIAVNIQEIITLPGLTDEQRSALLKLHENYHKHEQTEKLRKDLFEILEDREVLRFF